MLLPSRFCERFLYVRSCLQRFIYFRNGICLSGLAIEYKKVGQNIRIPYSAVVEASASAEIANKCTSRLTK